MPRMRLQTRARAWLLRTFAGRSRTAAPWRVAPEATAAGTNHFSVGDLAITAASAGVKAAGANPPAVVYKVEVRLEPRRRWTSSYGLEPATASAESAVEHALDELDEAWRRGDAWRRQVTDGMSEDEAEAMLDSPMVEADMAAAAWAGPALDAVRATTKARSGRWLAEVPPTQPPSTPPLPNRGEEESG